MSNIRPCLWFDGKAEEAAQLYTSLFGGVIKSVQKAPTDYPAGKEGDSLLVVFEIFGQEYLGLNGGPGHSYTDAVSFEVQCEDQAEVDRYWAALTEGGREVVCGWLQDKYGVYWQIIPRRMNELLADPDPERAKRAFTAMMDMVKLDVAELEKAAEGS